MGSDGFDFETGNIQRSLEEEIRTRDPRPGFQAASAPVISEKTSSSTKVSNISPTGSLVYISPKDCFDMRCHSCDGS